MRQGRILVFPLLILSDSCAGVIKAEAERPMTDSTSNEKSRLLRWLHGDSRVPWGAAAGVYQSELVAHTLDQVRGWLFGPHGYFSLDAKGFENVPAAPVMLVSNHSGGTTILDVWGFLFSWYDQFGVHRPLHPLAHEMVLGNRFTGPFFADRGVIRAEPDLAIETLTAFRQDVMVMPGGDVDAWRPYSMRYQVRFAGRKGYARIALKANVPIVPIANAGAQETFIVLTDGQWLALAFNLKKLARAHIWPIHLSLPWGLAIGPLPHIPIPTRLRYRIGTPIEPPERVQPGTEPSPALIDAYDALVRAAVQNLLDELRETRAH